MFSLILVFQGQAIFKSDKQICCQKCSGSCMFSSNLVFQGQAIFKSDKQIQCQKCSGTIFCQFYIQQAVGCFHSYECARAKLYLRVINRSAVIKCSGSWMFL